MTTVSPATAPPMTGLKHNRSVTAALAVLFWIPAAAGVVTAQRLLPAPAAVSLLAASAAIVATAFIYFRLTARDPSLDHALAVGITWLLLALTTEIVAVAWFRLRLPLLGSPQQDGLRHLLLFAWVIGPALFARRAD